MEAYGFLKYVLCVFFLHMNSCHGYGCAKTIWILEDRRDKEHNYGEDDTWRVSRANTAIPDPVKLEYVPMLAECL